MSLKPKPSQSIFPETLGLAPPRSRLTNRKILIVGAGQRTTVDSNPPVGNGRAIATLFAREGAHVVCLDSNAAAAGATVAAIRAEGGTAFPLVLDVRKVEEIGKAVDEAKLLMGGLDGLVCAVGISRGLPLSKITPQSWDDELAVNLRSHMLFAQRALAVMSDGGAIVLVSSMAGQRANSGNPAYETSKAAQLALARAVAREGEKRGLRCNVVAPGWVDTPMGRDASRHSKGRAVRAPLGRQATGWEVAYTALWLVSWESSYVSGICVNMDAGSLAGVDGRVTNFSVEKEGGSKL